jgi:hypothetical protein
MRGVGLLGGRHSCVLPEYIYQHRPRTICVPNLLRAGSTRTLLLTMHNENRCQTHRSSHLLCRLASDPVLAEISDRQVNRVIHDPHEHGEQEVPSQDRCHEPRSSAALLSTVSRLFKKTILEGTR